MKNFTEKVNATIEKYNLININDTVIVALSGGADSVALLYVLCELAEEYKLKIVIAHINHNLRGADSDADEVYVRKLSSSLGIKSYVHSENIDEYAKKHSISTEEAGRRVRYDFFFRIKEEINADKIATAHNKNDNAETLVMNFIRGSGLKGLCGIPHIRDGGIIRPLLEVTRKEIEDYCKDNNIFYRTDKTNFEQIYTRNRVRLNLIEQIKSEYNPNFVETITRNAQIINDDNDFMQGCAKEVFIKASQIKNDNCYIDIDFFNAQHIAIRRKMVLLAIKEIGLKTTNITNVNIEDILGLANLKKSGNRIKINSNIEVVIEYNNMVVRDFSRGQFLPNRQRLEQAKPIIFGDLQISVEYTNKQDSEKNAIYLDADKIGEMYIRSKKDGDRFYPVGMSGSKKLSDFFADKKIPLTMRDEIPIAVNENDEICSVLPYRVDRNFVCDEKTRKIIKIKVEQNV